MLFDVVKIKLISVVIPRQCLIWQSAWLAQVPLELYIRYKLIRSNVLRSSLTKLKHKKKVVAKPVWITYFESKSHLKLSELVKLSQTCS